MNICRCRQRETRVEANPSQCAKRWNRRGSLASWIIPSAVLALMPKCPICVAAYIALATGIGISLPAAAYLRSLLIAVCIAAIGIVAIKQLRNYLSRKIT